MVESSEWSTPAQAPSIVAVSAICPARPAETPRTRIMTKASLSRAVLGTPELKSYGGCFHDDFVKTPSTTTTLLNSVLLF